MTFSLRAKGILISEPRSSTLGDMRFCPRDKGNWPFSGDSLQGISTTHKTCDKRVSKHVGFKIASSGELSKLALLVHQQFWYPFGWFVGTQKGIKTDGFQNGKFWGLSKLAILVHQQFWYPFGRFRKVVILPVSRGKNHMSQGSRQLGLINWCCDLCGHLQRCQMPDNENSRKTAEKGAEWVTVKQPKNSRKNSRNTRKTVKTAVIP